MVKIYNVFKGDKVIWMVFFFLCLISIIEVFSASSGLTYKSQNFIMPMIKHSGIILVGLVFTIVVSHIPCRFFPRLTVPFLIISLLLLFCVLFIGDDVNGAQRQMNILGFSVQPSEIAKGTTVLAVAQILSALQTEDGAHSMAFKYIMWITVPIAFLIMLENLSTAVLLCAVVFLMMFIGRVPWKMLGQLLGLVMISVALLLAFIWFAGKDTEEIKDAEIQKMEMLSKVDTIDGVSEEVVEEEEEGAVEKLFHRADTWKARLMKFFNDEEVTPKEWDLDKDAQVAHANIAIASSNVIGVGPGNSVERDFLSQAFSDFIFAIIIEELGIIGAFFVVMFYVILMFRCRHIAGRCAESFPAFFVMGLGLLFVVQAMFNMMVAVGLLPVTGQPLPLISKGGSSTILNCIYIGAILSISRTALKVNEKPVTPAEDAEAVEVETAEAVVEEQVAENK